MQTFRRQTGSSGDLLSDKTVRQSTLFADLRIEGSH